MRKRIRLIQEFKNNHKLSIDPLKLYEWDDVVQLFEWPWIAGLEYDLQKSGMSQFAAHQLILDTIFNNHTKI